MFSSFGSFSLLIIHIFKSDNLNIDPCAPQLSNGWLSQFDPDIKGDANVYSTFKYTRPLLIFTKQGETLLIFLQYRRSDRRHMQATWEEQMDVPWRMIFTMRKLKTLTPSLKPPVERNLKSGVVYKMQCPRCTACYAGATTRHVITRFKE